MIRDRESLIIFLVGIWSGTKNNLFLPRFLVALNVFLMCRFITGLTAARCQCLFHFVSFSSSFFPGHCCCLNRFLVRWSIYCCCILGLCQPFPTLIFHNDSAARSLYNFIFSLTWSFNLVVTIFKWIWLFARVMERYLTCFVIFIFCLVILNTPREKTVTSAFSLRSGSAVQPLPSGGLAILDAARLYLNTP